MVRIGSLGFGIFLGTMSTLVLASPVLIAQPKPASPVAPAAPPSPVAPTGPAATTPAETSAPSAPPSAATVSPQPAPVTTTQSAAPAAPAPTPGPAATTPPAEATPVSPPAPAAAPPPAPTVPPHLDSALVHVAADYPGAVLELRSYVDSGDWRAACAAPCDRMLVTLGMQARVSAPGMTRSNAFRIEPGPGTALVKVSGGSETLRTFGIAGLAVGIPLALVGTGMYSYGKYSDKDGLTVAGAAVLGTGALALIAAIPMLIASTTNVRDARGSLIAAGAAGTAIH